MRLSKEAKIAVAVSVAGLLVITAILVWNFSWLFAGHVIFGFTIGLMVGMTKSSIVSAVLPLLFSFAGGSIVALSVGGNPTDTQLETLGSQLVGFGIGTSVGLLVGIVIRDLGVELPLGKFQD
jgi:hypothetical protein